MRGDRDLAAALQRVSTDGVVTEGEITAALKTIVKHTPTEAAAAALVKLLDTDRDGKVSVTQLNKLIAAFAKREEEAK
jgi:Ca2+-binding EF-hand superfamily protein